jgi:glutathione S-transferase
MLWDTRGMDDALACIATNDGPFKQALDRYKYPARLGLAEGTVARAAGAAVLMDWNRRLQQQAFLSGTRWGFADAAIAPFVRQFAHTDKAWFAAQDWQPLQRWLAAFEGSSAFAAVMEKVPVWQAGDAPRITRFAA